MERTPEIFEKIERYLTNRLSQEELAAFENEITNNPELQSEVAKHKALHNTLGDKDTLDFKEKLVKISKEAKEEESDAGKFLFSSPFKIAATIVVLLGVGALLWNTNENSDKIRDLYAVHYAPFPVEDITRGETDATLQHIMTSYNRGQYSDVVSTLEKNTSIIALKELQLYLGNSYLNTDQVQNAILQFENISKKSKYYEASRWYLSLAYLKLQKTKKTEQILEEIVQYKGVYKDHATRLLQALAE